MKKRIQAIFFFSIASLYPLYPSGRYQDKGVYASNRIVRRVLESCYNVEYSMDCCADTNHPVTHAYIGMKNIGVKLKFISEITEENLSYCKELVETEETRHLEEVKGNLIADEKLYHAGATANKSGPPSVLILSTVKATVDQQ